MTLQVDILTGCPFAHNAIEVKEAFDLLEWNPAEVWCVVEHVDADPEAGTPAGWSVQITGPQQLILNPPWFDQLVKDAHDIEAGLLKAHLEAQAREGKRLPPRGPIFSFGWEDERDLVIELLRLGCQQFKLGGISANI